MVDGPYGKKVDSRSFFAIVPERYYSQMFCVKVPRELSEFNKGADITGLLWRRQDKPREWNLQYRFRHYQTKGAWDGKDVKNWYWVRFPDNDEEGALADMRKVFEVLEVGAKAFTGSPLKFEIIEVHGDDKAWKEAVEKANPDWLHAQQQIME